MQKTVAEEVIESLPAEFDLDLLIERLILMEHIERAERSLAGGKGVPHEEATRQILSWRT